MTWMHYFFFSQCLQSEESQTDHWLVNLSDQVTRWTCDQKRDGVSLLLWYFILTDNAFLFYICCVCCINDANVASTKMNDNPSAGAGGRVPIRTLALHVPLLSHAVSRVPRQQLSAPLHEANQPAGGCINVRTDFSVQKYYLITGMWKKSVLIGKEKHCAIEPVLCLL